MERDNMDDRCMFCDSKADFFEDGQEPTLTCRCPVCGDYGLTIDARTEFQKDDYSDTNKRIIAIHIRDAWDKNGRRARVGPLSFEDLQAFIKKGRPEPLELIDQALIKLDSRFKVIAGVGAVDIKNDYPWFQCISSNELVNVLEMLVQEGWAQSSDFSAPQLGLRITAKGYARLRELQRVNQESRQGFVAMWYADEMKAVYENAIKPAIEFKEEGRDEPWFRAVRVDAVEHVNDINDEMIAQIRRSRFLVCDLTGYRGGVYFEAGFAYGLGLPVIYTCRQDWCDADVFIDAQGRPIKELRDSRGRRVSIKKEGIHFDLAHRNRIVWQDDTPDQLAAFKKQLSDRIKAVVI
jgi:nucleoside 2-deoxyribosyltransferase